MYYCLLLYYLYYLYFSCWSDKYNRDHRWDTATHTSTLSWSASNIDLDLPLICLTSSLGDTIGTFAYFFMLNQISPLAIWNFCIKYAPARYLTIVAIFIQCKFLYNLAMCVNVTRKTNLSVLRWSLQGGNFLGSQPLLLFWQLPRQLDAERINRREEKVLIFQMSGNNFVWHMLLQWGH